MHLLVEDRSEPTLVADGQLRVGLAQLLEHLVVHGRHLPAISGYSSCEPADATMVPVNSRTLYLVGGPPRVGKSTLAQRLLRDEGIAWLPTDVIRTVLRQVLADLDALDQDPVDASALAHYMYPHIEQAAEVCMEEAESFLIDGFELAPWYRDRLRAALEVVDVRACFLGHETFTAADLAGYRGPKPQHEDAMSVEELDASAAWIRARSRQLRVDCSEIGLCYIDVAEVGLESALEQARRALVS